MNILKGEGVELVKRKVFMNLHLKAGAEEEALLEVLINNLREVNTHFSYICCLIGSILEGSDHQGLGQRPEGSSDLLP